MTDETPSAELEILDPDLHVATFFVPAARRSSVEGLMLFALELERIATQVSEPMVAQIRYAWWREQVDAVFGGRGVAAPVAVRLREAVAEHGLPLEINRRHKPSVLLVRASDFEAALGRSHPWSERRARLSPGSFHPNGLQPGVTHRWQHASSTWIRDHFCSVLESVDTTGHPLLVTRRGPVVLTAGAPKSIDAIERTCAGR